MSKEKKKTPEDIRRDVRIRESQQKYTKAQQKEEEKEEELHGDKLRHLNKKYDDRFEILYVGFELFRKEYYLSEQKGEIRPILEEMGKRLGAKGRYIWDYIGSCEARIERIFKEFEDTANWIWNDFFFSKIGFLHHDIISELLGAMCKDCLEKIEMKPTFRERGLVGVSEILDEQIRERDEALERMKEYKRRKAVREEKERRESVKE